MARLPGPWACGALYAASIAVLLVSHLGHGWGFVDLRVYERGGAAVRQGAHLYALRFPGDLAFTYPPFAALLLAALTLPANAALELILTGTSLVLLPLMLALALRLDARSGPRSSGPQPGIEPQAGSPPLDALSLRSPQGRRRWALALAGAAAAVWLEPVWTTLRYGQIDVVIATLVVWDLSRVDSARSKGAGIGLATALKLTPGIFVVYLLLTRRTRAAVVSLAVFAATVALAYLALPGDSREYWGGAFAEPGRVGRIENAANQSLRGALARVLHTADVGGVWLGLAVVVGLAGMALAVGAARRGQEARGFALCALTGLLVSPVSWSHHWTLAVPALGLVALDARRRGSVVGLAACVLAAGIAYAHVIWWVPIDHPLHSELHLDAVGLVLADAYVLAGLVALGAAAVCATRRALTHDARSVEVLVSRGSHGVTHAHRRAKVVSVLALALVGGLAVLVPARSLASGLSGDQCPTPTVSIFDLAVPAASGHQDVEHLVLQSSSAGLSQVLIDDDPSHSQIQYLDYQVAQGAQNGKPIKIGAPDLPPGGPLEGVDYLVEGAITGGPGAYTVSVSLEDAVTRAVIATGSATFATAEQGLAATEQAARQLTPALNEIRAYQQRLRDAGGNVAILAALAVTPERQSVKVGESTPVKLALGDCDGQPLKDRTLELRASGGTLTPATVTTDAQGLATVTFRARRRGVAKVIADYGPYTTVTHKPNMAQGEALVNVSDPLTDKYVIETNASWTYEENAEITNPFGLETTVGSGQGSAHIVEWGTGDPTAPGSCSVCGHFHVQAAAVTGTLGHEVTTNQRETIAPGCTSASEKTFQAGQPRDGVVSIAKTHGAFRVAVEVSFMAKQLETSQASAGCDTPGSTSAETLSGYVLLVQNIGEFQGTCSGTSTHIECNASHTYGVVSSSIEHAHQTESGTVSISIRRLRASETGHASSAAR
jgi:alpha-1,2-mannosyltransferase